MKRTIKKAVSFFMTAAVVAAVPFAGLTLKADAANSKVEAAIKWACDIAADDSHGYSDGSAECDNRPRTGPDYDCSSLVTTAFMKAGFEGISVSSAGSMKDMFTKSGFQWIPAGELGGLNDDSDLVYLQRGDILLDVGTHTELYIGDGKTVGAHWDWDGEAGGYGEECAPYYRSGADEINIQGAYLSAFNYDGVLRYKDESVKTGDIDADGKINSSDALLVLQHSAGRAKLTGDRFTRADVNKDKSVNSSDALRILQYSVGQISKF